MAYMLPGAAVNTAHAPPVAVYIHVQLRQALWPETMPVGTGSTRGPPHVSWGDMAQCTRLHSEERCVSRLIRHVKGSDKARAWNRRCVSSLSMLYYSVEVSFQYGDDGRRLRAQEPKTDWHVCRDSLRLSLKLPHLASDTWR